MGPAVDGTTRPFLDHGQALEFDCSAKHLSRLHDQVLDVLEGDVLIEVPEPDLFGNGGDPDDTRRPESCMDGGLNVITQAHRVVVPHGNLLGETALPFIAQHAPNVGSWQAKYGK
ncbi:hypothetical protein LB533_25035 [Mesorhizobium sp. BR1-1-13]|uniref:hypothetical protein n=1 Tax=Mesorhizobium sp. BR1-1-13 TaxID=2876656 RepID=UPI001CD0CDE2|nr:hypothetical protein [Mesorhizobium sp. BR1-1-13]MBZ9944363.1 hypothetical protein [Mesorhizobium sp. BR1-1-13]